MKMVHIVKGKTYSYKDHLKRIGFKWFPHRQLWWKPWDMDSLENVKHIQDSIEEMPDVDLIDTDLDVMQNALLGHMDWLDRELLNG